MNELERLIAGIDLPQPSSHLDDRVRAVLADRSFGARKRGLQDTLILCGVAACVGVLGFFLGRQSVSASADARQLTSAASVPEQRHRSLAATSQVMRVPLPEEQVASFFARSAAREGMLGNGPVRFDIRSAP